MANETTKIEKVSAATKSAIARKSAQTLPNRPSEMGYSAEEIKRRLYQIVLDSQNSALAEIDRVVDAVNSGFYQIDDFLGNAEIKAPYKSDLGSTWVLNETAGRYEVVVPKEIHGIEDYKEISVDMYLIDTDGKLINVNNYDIYTNGNVVLYNDNQGGGFVTISRNRDGFVRGDVITDVDNITGIAKVAKTNLYSDLDGKPDLVKMQNNEQQIGKIISGATKVGSAANADNAANANFATNANYATESGTAATAARATNDGAGNNIHDTYAKKTEVPSATSLYAHHVYFRNRIYPITQYNFSILITIYNDKSSPFTLKSLLEYVGTIGGELSCTGDGVISGENRGVYRIESNGSNLAIESTSDVYGISQADVQTLINSSNVFTDNVIKIL